MSGRIDRMRATRSWSCRPSSTATTSITIAPAPSAARCADSAVIVLTTPVTSICKPPPALEVDRYRSAPTSPTAGVFTARSARNRRPVSSSSSPTALSTPTVTSSKGASTVVGASPRPRRRYSPSTRSIRIAFVVVEPQSVATIRVASDIVTYGARIPTIRQRPILSRSLWRGQRSLRLRP